jgi:hypothetical protein
MQVIAQGEGTYEKEAEVSGCHSSNSVLGVLVKCTLNQHLFLLLKLEYTIFDGSRDNKSVDKDGALLSNAMRTIDSLKLYVGVVERI